MTDQEWSNIEHFKPEEFDSPDAPGSGKGMDEPFVRALDHLRDRVGFPLPIKAGFRTKAHNASVGGVKKSAHMKGLAADIGYKTSQEAFAIIDGALYMGFKRIEFCDKHIHLDMDNSLPQKVMVWGVSK
jgi:hypothetical protein